MAIHGGSTAPPATGLTAPETAEIGRLPLSAAQSYLIRCDAPWVSLLRRICFFYSRLQKLGDGTRDGFVNEHRHSRCHSETVKRRAEPQGKEAAGRGVRPRKGLPDSPGPTAWVRPPDRPAGHSRRTRNSARTFVVALPASENAGIPDDKDHALRKCTTTRKPILSFRLSDALLFRYAERQFCGLLFHEPRRNTRYATALSLPNQPYRLDMARIAFSKPTPLCGAANNSKCNRKKGKEQENTVQRATGSRRPHGNR